MKVKIQENTRQKYLILKENESIIILAEKQIKSAVHILCQNNKLILEFDKPLKKKNKSFIKKS
ncbi:MAG: hypothetical protein HFI09_05530 [Bacilli bacterium]|nr:hypothetical protein [Bacilli bacterium]